MTRDDAITLIDYHYWARDRMLDAVEALTQEQYTKDLASSFTSVRATVVHMYGAEWNWYLRWVSNSPTGFPDAAAFPDVRTIRAAWRSQRCGAGAMAHRPVVREDRPARGACDSRG